IRPYKIKQARQDCAAAFPARELDEALALPGGEKTKGWRDAVRAYVLLRVLYASRGGSSLVGFTTGGKTPAKQHHEEALQQGIRKLLDAVKVKTFHGHIAYQDTGDNAVKVSANVFRRWAGRCCERPQVSWGRPGRHTPRDARAAAAASAMSVVR